MCYFWHNQSLVMQFVWIFLEIFKYYFLQGKFKKYEKNFYRVRVIFSEMICEDSGRSSSSYRIWGSTVSPHWEFGTKMLSKCKKIVYSLTLSEVRYSDLLSLKCKQKLWFPWRQKSQQKESFDLWISQKLLKVTLKKTNSFRKLWFADC